MRKPSTVRAYLLGWKHWQADRMFFGTKLITSVSRPINCPPPALACFFVIDWYRRSPCHRQTLTTVSGSCRSADRMVMYANMHPFSRLTPTTSRQGTLLCRDPFQDRSTTMSPLSVIAYETAVSDNRGKQLASRKAYSTLRPSAWWRPCALLLISSAIFSVLPAQVLIVSSGIDDPPTITSTLPKQHPTAWFTSVTSRQRMLRDLRGMHSGAPHNPVSRLRRKLSWMSYFVGQNTIGQQEASANVRTGFPLVVALPARRRISCSMRPSSPRGTCSTTGVSGTSTPSTHPDPESTSSCPQQSCRRVDTFCTRAQGTNRWWLTQHPARRIWRYLLVRMYSVQGGRSTRGMQKQQSRSVALRPRSGSCPSTERDRPRVQEHAQHVAVHGHRYAKASACLTFISRRFDSWVSLCICSCMSSASPEVCPQAVRMERVLRSRLFSVMSRYPKQQSLSDSTVTTCRYGKK
mmetsp:Transcript_38127/g.91568  ORF Transcript_38127/g.91568 Transcript_38127/m.91568 type:complete len:463 (-) Transcript_38127:840-2228(-)